MNRPGEETRFNPQHTVVRTRLSCESLANRFCQATIRPARRRRTLLSSLLAACKGRRSWELSLKTEGHRIPCILWDQART